MPYATIVVPCVDVSPWDLIGGVVTLGDAYRVGNADLSWTRRHSSSV